MKRKVRPVKNLFMGVIAAFTDTQVLFLVMLTATAITCAAFYYRWTEGWGMLDAVYFSVVTISTIGYGDLTPQTPAGKLFTIFYVFCGLGLFVAMASAIAGKIISHTRQSHGDIGDK